MGSGFARLGCPEAAAPAGGRPSGLCKFILLGFVIVEDPVTKIAPSSLSCPSFSQWARCGPGVQLQGVTGLPAAFLRAAPSTAVRPPQLGLGGCCKNTLSDCAGFQDQTLPTCFQRFGRPCFPQVPWIRLSGGDVLGAASGGDGAQPPAPRPMPMRTPPGEGTRALREQLGFFFFGVIDPQAELPEPGRCCRPPPPRSARSALPFLGFCCPLVGPGLGRGARAGGPSSAQKPPDSEHWGGAKWGGERLWASTSRLPGQISIYGLWF